MKIAILTHSLATNYGGLLQNYALQTVIKKLGHEPITLNHYSNNGPTIYVKILSIISRLLRKIRGENVVLRAWPTAKEYQVISANTSSFINRYINTTQPFLINKIKDLDFYYDAIIVGSDQVWRYQMMKNDILYMFCSFITTHSIKKIAYAASFGTDSWEMPSNITSQVLGLAHKFDAISVREKSGLDLCKKYLDKEAHLVLDPTFLLTAYDYSMLIDYSQTTSCQSKDRISTYILDRDSFKDKIVNQIAEKKGLLINNLRPNSKFSEVGKDKIMDCVFIPVEAWLKGIKNAEMVITDSFHGTVFSIIFNKPFWVLKNSKRGNTRIDSILECFGLEKRCISDLPTDFDSPIDWSYVNKRKQDLVNESMTFLQQSLLKNNNG